MVMNGGPAFCGTYKEWQYDSNGNGQSWEESSPGMSKRQYFAAHAPEVPGWFEGHPPLSQETRKEIFFEWRFYYADEMLRQGGQHV